jgi:hypothetical protein
MTSPRVIQLAAGVRPVTINVMRVAGNLQRIYRDAGTSRHKSTGWHCVRPRKYTMFGSEQVKYVC